MGDKKEKHWLKRLFEHKGLNKKQVRLLCDFVRATVNEAGFPVADEDIVYAYDSERPAKQRKTTWDARLVFVDGKERVINLTIQVPVQPNITHREWDKLPHNLYDKLPKALKKAFKNDRMRLEVDFVRHIEALCPAAE